MVNIHLSIDGGQVLALVIPFSDIQRLSLRPLKWLRYVTFTICGVRGDLSETPGGPTVDYAAISLSDPIPEDYYYTPQGAYRLIDYMALNDRITSSEPPLCCTDFRRDVIARDGHSCLFTNEAAEECDAVHIIPRNKGDQYITSVIQDRLNSYDSTLELENLSINSVENGLLVAKTLHALFGHGKIAFIKTPNFALDPVDIPRVETDPMPPSRITLQHLVPPVSNFPIPACDACFLGTGISRPPNILLDYMYGAAAYKCWGGGQDIDKRMQQRFEDCYKSIPVPELSLPSDSDDDSEPEASDDPDYQPHRHSEGRHHRSKVSEGVLNAMDKILGLSMLLKGHTFQSITAEQQRREEEGELRAKEASQAKVQQWMHSSACPLPSSIPDCPREQDQGPGTQELP